MRLELILNLVHAGGIFYPSWIPFKSSELIKLGHISIQSVLNFFQNLAFSDSHEFGGAGGGAVINRSQLKMSH